MTIQANRVATGLSLPVFAASAPGDPNRLFVLEKDSGQVKILDLANDQVSAQPFFDVPATDLSTIGEQGLLGLAFHPDYADNGKFYLDLINEAGDQEIWQVTQGSVDVILTIDRTATNHMGGWMGFGPDGNLYITTGDSGGANDPENAAQNLNDLRGKILRIDVDGDDFPGATPGAVEIFASGLRNPWRASFDSTTGDFYIADVGQNAREEINYLPAGTGAGTNFGWRVMEGTLATGNPQLTNPPAGDPSFRAPIFEYGQDVAGGASMAITGGYVYHGPGGGQGLYFFADSQTSRMWTLRVDDGEAFDFTRRDDEIVSDAGTVDQIVSYAVDGNNRLYAIGLDGEIFQLTPSADVGTPFEGSPSAGEGGGDWEEALLIAGVALGLAAWFF